ncbi:MAG: alpha/beta hydrolase [Pseudomonadota bacterium]
MRHWIIAAVALIALGLGLWVVTAPRAGLQIDHLNAGQTPVTVMRQADATGPVVVIAHGFAGSRQLMAAWQLTLAQAGYITASFDFEGHGRNPVPMSGDVTSIDGTTRLLMEELGRVTDLATDLPGAAPRVALLGHSMASDVVVRQSLVDPRVEAVVAVSLFSEAVTAEAPRNLLILNGAWEGMLRAEAERVMGEVGGAEGETVGVPGREELARRAVAVPFVEHVGVLYAPTGPREALVWLNATFDLDRAAAPVHLGPGILIMLFGAVLLAMPLARLMPEGPAPWHPSLRVFLALAILPAIVTPLVLSLFETRVLPVLVADYLALHLALYGALVLVGAIWAGGRPRLSGWVWGLGLAAFGLLLFGGLMDRYVASFYPHAGRWAVMAFILPGAVLAMMGDAVLLEATRAALWRRILARGAFLGSLGIAVALDFERLFFLIIILPVIALFYASFGMMGRWVGRRTGSVVAMGLGLGIILGWALGVTFPMFDPGAGA